jgi:hypothetical protein
MMNLTGMEETMKEIGLSDESQDKSHKAETLRTGIMNLEKDIKDAELRVEISNAEHRAYAPVTPEQANERKKNIVFLKKDLTKMKTEYEQLS